MVEFLLDSVWCFPDLTPFRTLEEDLFLIKETIRDTVVVYTQAQTGDLWDMVPDEFKGVITTVAGGGAIYGGVKGTGKAKRKLAAMKLERQMNKGGGNNQKLEKRLSTLENRLTKLETEKECSSMLRDKTILSWRNKSVNCTKNLTPVSTR